MPRIAILVAHWSLHSNVCYLALCLGRANYLVDLFLFDSDDTWSAGLLQPSDRINVYRFFSGSPSPSDKGDIPRGVKKAKTSAIRTLYTLLPSGLRDWNKYAYNVLLSTVYPEFRLLPRPLVRAMIQRATSTRYAAIIAVEKEGLTWAGPVATHTGVPIIYYSLELYTRDHPWVLDSITVQRFKATEEKYHKRCALTLIQDEHRGRVLLTSNGVSSLMPMAYLPVSSFGPCTVLPSQRLHEELGLASKTIILCYGEISETRLSLQLTGMAQQFPDDWRLVFHGHGSRETLDHIRSLDSKGRVALSLRVIPAAQRQELISSARIGLAIYQRAPLNDQLTGLSSEKIALYLQSALPVVAFRYRSYEHIEEQRAGMLVDHISEIPNAICEILANYEFYKHNALACYKRYYSFEENFKNFNSVLTALHGLGGC